MVQISRLSNMKMPRNTIGNLHEQFPDDNACLNYMFLQRFGAVVAWPKCGVTEPTYDYFRSTKVKEIKVSSNQISSLTNTMVPF